MAMVMSSSVMRNFPSPWRINFAGEVVRDVAVEEVLRKVSSPENKASFFSSATHRRKTKGKNEWLWLRIGRKKTTKSKKPQMDIRTSKEFDDDASGDSDSEWDSDSDMDDSYFGDDDTKATYETKYTVETVNTKQYEEFVKQENKEILWSAFFCGVCRGDDYGDDHDDYSQPSISTQTKPAKYGSTVAAYDMESRRTLSIISDSSDSSASVDSDCTEGTEPPSLMVESTFIF